ncbi:Probable terpene synthase 3 [Linum grandiflorum]
MKQYGVSKKEAHLELNKMVENYWKDMNEEITLQAFDKAPLPILMTIVNIVLSDGLVL